MSTFLSPSAQAVLDAYRNTNTMIDGPNCAAVLRAAADDRRLGPEHWEGSHPDDYEKGWNAALENIEDIATELEGMI